jgi:hypothetical protein
VAEAAERLGVRHEAALKCNENGTPYIHDAFAKAEKYATYNTLCYCNADIILLPSLIRGVELVEERFSRFLLTGRRWNLDVDEKLTLAEGWGERLMATARQEGELFTPDGIDYFIFRRHSLGELRPFLVGRPAWDNYTLFQAHKQGLAVVDGTERIFVVHQNHGYGHVPQGSGKIWDGPEMKQNTNQLDSVLQLFTLQDSRWCLSANGLEKRGGWEYWSRFPLRLCALNPFYERCYHALTRRWRRLGSVFDRSAKTAENS